MRYRKMNKYIKLVAVAGTIIILDQITKSLILGRMALYDSFAVVPGFFNIVHIHNQGGAFGLLAGQSEMIRYLVFVLLSAVAVGVIYYLYVRTPVAEWLQATGLALIFGGAIGNMIDRLRFGYVVDFLDFYLKGWHYPAFNVADSAITVGIGLFLLQMLTQKTQTAP